jgi:hypothetical protein
LIYFLQILNLYRYSAVSRIRLSVVSRAMDKWMAAVQEGKRMQWITAKGRARPRCIQSIP